MNLVINKETEAAAHCARYLQVQIWIHVQELTYQDRRRVHNLKYFTWVEQQGKKPTKRLTRRNGTMTIIGLICKPRSQKLTL